MNTPILNQDNSVSQLILDKAIRVADSVQNDDQKEAAIGFILLAGRQIWKELSKGGTKPDSSKIKNEVYLEMIKIIWRFNARLKRG